MRERSRSRLLSIGRPSIPPVLGALRNPITSRRLRRSRDEETNDEANPMSIAGEVESSSGPDSRPSTARPTQPDFRSEPLPAISISPASHGPPGPSHLLARYSGSTIRTHGRSYAKSHRTDRPAEGKAPVPGWKDDAANQVAYLVLSITKRLNSRNEFTVILILIILFTTIFFCYALLRLCMAVAKPEGEEEQASGRQPMLALGGYAIPRVPIRVVLARDEEAAGVESETTKLRPPAYGLWRESVRVDPNRLFWQRNDDPQVAESSGWSEPRTGPRPPSYASEDGVSYVRVTRSMRNGRMIVMPDDG
ncbi:unnamed protein product [Parascedosporium putredinis]|uniref:Uncharacterized protein n=1 Tax=Parascedosporium putredinis TaxID=1442378 RepID=A0A9P1H2W5_9PEZI|nr:unnamed protein product [Parascedosporium putredinis]CAI7995342.1 unnamed protein product [Parascedosporium putredinis]